MVTGTTVKTIFITPEAVQAPPPPATHQDLPDTGGDNTKDPKEQDLWVSWSSVGASHQTTWYQSEMDMEMEKRNKHYAERDKESLSLARALWPAGDLRVSGSLPLYMIRCHEMGKFMKREQGSHTSSAVTIL